MMCQENTFDGKLPPKHVKLFRDCDSGRIELRYRRFHPITRQLRIKNGYRSETICAAWDDDAMDFAIEMIKHCRR